MILVESNPKRRKRRRSAPRTKSGRFRKRKSGGRRKGKATRRRRYSSPKKRTYRRKRKSNPRFLSGLTGRGEYSLAGAAMTGAAMFAGGWLQSFSMSVLRAKLPQVADRLPEWASQALTAYAGSWILRRRIWPRFLRNFAKPFLHVGMYRAVYNLAQDFVPPASQVAARVGLGDWLEHRSPQLNAYVSRGSEAGLAPVHQLGFYGDGYNEYGEVV